MFQKIRDEEGEEHAIASALSLDPSDLFKLILRSNLLERQGKRTRPLTAMAVWRRLRQLWRVLIRNCDRRFHTHSPAGIIAIRKLARSWTNVWRATIGNTEAKS